MSLRRVLTAAVGLAFLVGGLAIPVHDAWAQRQKREKPQTRRVKAASPKVFKKLQAIVEAIQAEDWPSARELLDDLYDDKLSDYERALMLQNFGHLYAAQGDFENALPYFERALSSGGFEGPQLMNLKYNVGQLYIATEQYRRGIQVLKEWLEVAENPKADVYFYIGQAYVPLDDYDNALHWVIQGLERMERPRENWLQLALGLYFEKKRYRDCKNVLEQLVTHFPKKQYWVQLAAMYGELGQEIRQLAAFEIAYRAGYLDRSREKVQLAQLYLYHEVPYKAALVLDKGLEDGSIEKDEKNYELLANSWIHAREYANSEPPLKEAARRSEKGELYVRLAQVYFEREAWREAVDALNRGIKKGELRNTGQAYILLGIANYNLGRNGSARQAFRRAANFQKNRRDANRWLRYIQQEASAE